MYYVITYSFCIAVTYNVVDNIYFDQAGEMWSWNFLFPKFRQSLFSDILGNPIICFAEKKYTVEPLQSKQGS